jgi:hypothetical protein
VHHACARACAIVLYYFKRGSVPPRCALGSAALHKFSLRNDSNERAYRERRRLRRKGRGVRNLSAFVCPYRLFCSSRSSGKTYANLLLKIPYKFKKSCGDTPEPQTTQDASWLHGPSIKIYSRYARARDRASVAAVSRHLHGIVSVTHLLPTVPDYELLACTGA